MDGCSGNRLMDGADNLRLESALFFSQPREFHDGYPNRG